MFIAFSTIQPSVIANLQDLGVVARQILIRCIGPLRPQKMGWGRDPANPAIGVWFCTTGSHMDINTSGPGGLDMKGNGTSGWNEMLGSGGTEVRRSSGF